MQMARITQQPESYAEVRAIGMCTRAATVKLVRSIRTEAYACQEGQKITRAVTDRTRMIASVRAQALACINT